MNKSGKSRSEGQFEHLLNRPKFVSQIGGHRRGALPLLAETGNRDRQRFVGADEMTVTPPSFGMQEQMIGILSQRPGFAHEGSDAPADSKIDALDEGGLDESGKAVPDEAGEALFFEQLVEILALTPVGTSFVKGQNVKDTINHKGRKVNNLPRVW